MATAVNITAYARFYEGLAAMTPREGVRVFALDASFAVIATTTTGADGRASVDMPNGGSVTLAYPDVPYGKASFRSWVTTYFGVKPGDNLTVGDSFSEGPLDNPIDGSISVSWPVVANATDYRLFSPCTNGDYFDQPASAETVEATIDLRPGCATMPTAPLAVVAYAAGDVIASIFLPATAFVDATVLDLQAGQWVAQAATPNFTVTASGLGAEADLAQLGARGNFGMFSTSQYLSGATIENGMATAEISVPSTAVRTTAQAYLRDNVAIGRRRFYVAGASPASIDTSTMPLIADYPTVDEALRTVTWTQSAGTYDLAMLQFRWGYLDGDDFHSLTWNAILPPGVTELDASTLPAQLADLIPPSTDFNLVNVRLVDLSNPASYDEARALPEWDLSYPDSGVNRGSLPAAAIADGGEGSNIWEPYNPPY